MKGYLLDTSIALTAVDQPQRLTKGVRRALDRGPAFLSVMAYWEVMIKSMNGTLQVGDPRQWWQETLAALSLLPLSWRPEHVAELYGLPPIHRDPFDRAIIAQAIVEDLVLLTADAEIPKYASGRFQPLT